MSLEQSKIMCNATVPLSAIPAAVQGLTHAELKDAYLEPDIFVDQLVAGWYGTATIEAMATGCPTVCFVRDTYAEHCPFFDRIPIINADPDSIYNVMKKILQGRINLTDISKRSIDFVRDVHAADSVARHLLTTLASYRR